jgi:hypothetical protein
VVLPRGREKSVFDANALESGEARKYVKFLTIGEKGIILQKVYQIIQKQADLCTK